jgi:hypothetical protein
MAIREASIPARRTAAFCSRTDRPSLAAFDDQRNPFSLMVHSANRKKLGPGGGSRAQK